MWNLKLNKDSKVLSNKIITFIVLPVMGEKFTVYSGTLDTLPCLQVLFKLRKIHRKKEKKLYSHLDTEPLTCVSLAQTHSSVSLTLEDMKV